MLIYVKVMFTIFKLIFYDGKSRLTEVDQQASVNLRLMSVP